MEEPAPKRKKEATKLYEPPARRKKSIPEALDVKKAAPSTPTRPTSTPTVATQKASSQSPPAATPSVPASKKTNVDLLTAATATSALKRETSRESQAQVPTPSATSSSPAPNSQQPPTAAALKSTTTSAPAPATKTPRQKAWEAHRTTLETLGRELKHAAQPNRSSDSSATTRPSPSELRHARRTNALKSLESLLAYFLAFTCTDEAEREASRPLSTRPWRTLYNYFPFVREQTKPFPPLSGLASSLAVVFCAHIANGLAPRGPEAGAAVVEAWGFMAREGKDAEARLDVQKLMAAFPKAWAKASVDGSEEPLEPGKFEGSFKLPLGVQTAPVQAVRAAYAMMQEWIGKEGAEYDLKLRLDMA